MGYTGKIDDCLIPKNLVLPLISGGSLTTPPQALIICSGAKIWFYNGSGWEIVTSA